MNVNKVLIRGIEIPFKKGMLRMSDYREENIIEVELLVHPTIVSYLDTINLIKERVTILLRNKSEINGIFDVHIGKSSILLTGNVRDTEGTDKLVTESNKNENGYYLLFQQGEGTSVNNELSTKKQLLLITILLAINENVIEDKENRILITKLIKKLENGEKLNSLDRFIKEEIGYILDEIMIRET